MSPCTLHTSYSSGDYSDPLVENTLIPDARQLLQSAYSLMSSLDPASSAYISIQSAASMLEGVIQAGNPSSTQVASAMAMLTQAMASAY